MLFPAVRGDQTSSRSRPSRCAWLAAIAGLVTFALLPAVAAANPKPVPVTDLEIAKTADRAEAAPGDAVTWTVTVRNAGTAGVPLALIAVDDPGAVRAVAGFVGEMAGAAGGLGAVRDRRRPGDDLDGDDDPDDDPPVQRIPVS